MKKKFNYTIDCAVILCGGKGSRLGDIGKKKNKSLLLVNNNPIIYYIVKQLLKEKFKKIILPLGYKGNDIKKYIRKKFVKDLSKFIFINTGINSEISERITKIKKFIHSKGSLLLVNGDTIFDFNLNNFFNSHFKKNKNISLATFSPKIDLGLIEIKKNKPIKFKKSIFIYGFLQNKIKYLAYSGLLLLKSKYLKNFSFDSKTDFEEKMFNKSMKLKNVNFFEVKKGICFPIDNVKNLHYANNFLKLKN